MKKIVLSILSIISLVILLSLMFVVNARYQPSCGDGSLQSWMGEECDDGNNDGCDDYCNLEVPDCIGADYVYNVDLGVCGDGCHSTCSPQDTVSINVPVGGAYSIIGQVWRGNPGQCQTNEDFYLGVNGDTGPETEDDADPCAITVRLDDLGDFTFNSGTNSVIMHTASECPPDCQANSVVVKKLCLYAEAVCGDGKIDSGEECDYGANNGVPCNPPYGGSCTYCSDTCEKIILTGGYCGDGNIDSGYEECDDGNNINGDGCSAICQVELISYKKESDRRNIIHINLIAFDNEFVRAGDELHIYLNFENKANFDLKDARITAILRELGIRSNTLKSSVVGENEESSKHLILEIPEYAQPGRYWVEIVIDIDGDRRIKYRPIDII